MIFNMLGQYFDGGRMLDLFAGSGAFGIEALSRGIDHVDFVENFALAKRTIEGNIIKLNMSDHSSIHLMDVFSFLDACKDTYHLIIADPPYALEPYEELLKRIVYGHLLADGGIIVFEADRNSALPEGFENCMKYREKISGNTKFAFYRMGDSQ